MSGVLLALAYAAVFLWVVQRWRFLHTPLLGRTTVSVAFLLKVAAGTLLWYIYSAHYTDRATADIFKYYDDGNVLFSALHAHPTDYFRMLTGLVDDPERFDRLYFKVMNNWYRDYEGAFYNDSHVMIRFNAIVRLFSFGHYHVHTVFACALSTIGLVALYRAFEPFLRGVHTLLAGVIFLLPTILFWGSGVLKEALLLFALGPWMLGVIRWASGRRDLRTVLVVLASTLLLSVLKVYVLGCLVPAALMLLWNGPERTRGLWWRGAVVYGVACLLVVVGPSLLPIPDPAYVIAVKQNDMINLVGVFPTGSYVPSERLAPTWSSLLGHAPHALHLTFLSPFRMFGSGLLGLLAGAENFLLLLMLPAAWYYRRPWSEVRWPVLLFCALFTLFMALLIGWTTPVVGAIVRYRLPMLPFAAIVLLLLVDPRRLPSWTQRPLP